VVALPINFEEMFAKQNRCTETQCLLVLDHRFPESWTLPGRQCFNRHFSRRVSPHLRLTVGTPDWNFLNLTLKGQTEESCLLPARGPVTINYGHSGVKVKTGDCSTKVKRPVVNLHRLKGKHSILIVSPTSTSALIQRNWFRLSQLATMVAIDLQKPYAKSELGMNLVMYCRCLLT
jgi:hypothetical protein